MLWNDTSNLTGVVQEGERRLGLGVGGISGNTTNLKAFIARCGQALDRFYTIAFKYDALWNFDDRNQTDLPIASTNVISGQQDYQFATELLGVTQVFIKDSSGVYAELEEQDDRNDPEAYLRNTTSGLPTHYELVGNSILLLPIPNYNSTLGLKVTFKRNGVKPANDVANDVSPGIPSLFHPYLANFASLQFAIDKQLDNRRDLAALVDKDEQAIRDFISNRAKPKKAGLRVRQESNR